MFTIPIAGGGLGAGSNLKFEILHSVKLPTSCILHSAGLIREMSRILRFIHRNRASPFDRQPRGRTMLNYHDWLRGCMFMEYVSKIECVPEFLASLP
ncbi:hypothetical protein VTN49DRAFT_4428 [Thermomyces lanuginosus]|uniref:uncharacterized protein n=1 Tax=Thermomyces lanuginosus TaxID=5541 RepID=UPI003742883F